MYFYHIIFLCFISIICVSTEEEGSVPMSKEERINLREEARKMFYHAYDAYIDNALPADELMPLSCKGRWRGVTPSRGDLDDVLGNFSLTLVDTLDTLVIIGDIQEFDKQIKFIIDNLDFDTDVVVSVFETNIRMLGGLLSAHVLASELSETVPVLGWYTNELLILAEDLGRRLLPAFNTTTGIPHGRVNLRHGIEGLSQSRETCTACAGTMILEFAALSRLTGDPTYEQKASRTMDRLWKIRHRTSDLMGTTIDVHSGDWVRKDAGVGAGIDSYYEYCLKAYILLGDNKYLKRFNRHYNAIKKYISRGPLMLAVYMHRPHLQSRNFMDALLAFWPGVQVMMGDVRPAVETHEMLYQVMQRHTFIPEAFTSDFQVHWGQYPLRPEFLESTYFLHRATLDDHYLYVGKNILRSLQQYARVPCGYAAVNDVRTRVHEDRMDSFVLAETFKYLFMLFSEDKDLPVDIEKFVMTTEAHFLPLSLGYVKRNVTARSAIDEDEEDRTRRTCPSTSSLHPAKVREPMRKMIGARAARPPARLRPISDPRQLTALADMGISVLTLPDGRVQLLYTTSTARSANDAAEGLTFMREMSKWNTLSDADNGVHLLGIQFRDQLLTAGPAHFGIEISGEASFQGQLALVEPRDACSEITNRAVVANKFGIAFRGQCTFTQKVRYMQLADIKMAIVIDNTPDSSSENSVLFAMSNDGKEAVDVVIPSAFLYTREGRTLLDALAEDPELMVTVAEKGRFQRVTEEGQVSPATERESFDNLKTVLAELVAHFELSLNSDEPPKRPQYKFPTIMYAKQKFGHEKNPAEGGEQSGADAEANEEPQNKKEELKIIYLDGPVADAEKTEDSANESTAAEMDADVIKPIIKAYSKEHTLSALYDYNTDDDSQGALYSEETSDESVGKDRLYDIDQQLRAVITEAVRNKNFAQDISIDAMGPKKSLDLNIIASCSKAAEACYKVDKESPIRSKYDYDRFAVKRNTKEGITEFTIEPDRDSGECSKKSTTGKSKMREFLDLFSTPSTRYYHKYAEERGLLSAYRQSTAIYSDDDTTTDEDLPEDDVDIIN